jgi:stage V sporulation protein B
VKVLTQKVENTFVKGAIILTIANILVKLIGALFRIPLTNLVGTYSMGLYSTAYRYYTVLLTIATAGLPIAISKMISESRALGRYRETSRILKIALITCAMLGLFGTLIMFFGAKQLAMSVNDINADSSLIALSPAVLFISVAAALRGYFQGHGNMLPTAMSQVLEAASRLFIGLLIAYLMIQFGAAEKYVAAGTICGITAGTILSALLLSAVFIYFKRKPAPREESEPDNYKEKSGGKLFEGLLKIAVPVTIGALIMNLTSAIDMFFITNRLAVLGYSSTQTTSMFGIYDNLVVPLFNLIPSVLISLNVSVTPVISASFAVRDFKTLHGTLASALRIIVVLTLPAAVGISVLSGPILGVLFSAKADVAIAAPVLSIMSVGSFFLCASSLTSTAMQALGRAEIPVMTMIAGAAVKIIANFLLISIPGVELNGAAVGTDLCYITITVLNLIILAKLIGFKPGFKDSYLKPLVSACVMGAVVFPLYSLLTRPFNVYISLAVSILIGITVYFVLLIKTGGISRQDILLIPGGEKIAGKLFK